MKRRWYDEARGKRGGADALSKNEGVSEGEEKCPLNEGLSALLGRWSDSREEIGAEIVTEGILFLSMTDVIEKFRRK